MVAICAVWHNWLRIDKSRRITPAMAVGLSDSVLDWANIVVLMELEAPKPGPRGAYRKGSTNESAVA